MTSQQILKADLLDILFENRNKLYGAYQLRKSYNMHLAKAIFIALGSVVLAVNFIKPGASQASAEPLPDKGFVVVDQIAPPVTKPTPPPARTDAPVQKSLARQVDFTNLIKVTEDEIETIMPPQDALDQAVISNTTTAGPDVFGFQPIPVTEAGGKGAAVDSAPAEKPAEVKPDKQPQFPGGLQAWIAFLNRNLQAPSDLESGEKRTVLIRFHVAEDGSITNFAVVQSAGAVFDNEVIRVLKKMPKWPPAMQAGNPVSVSFTQPVTFVGMDE